MKCLMMATFDTATGEYEVELRNLAQPGAGIDYDVFREAIRRVFSDMDRRVEDAREAAEGETAEISLFGNQNAKPD